MRQVKIAPSILAADLLQLETQIQEVVTHGADFIHVDVMDGQFVPNLTFGPVMVKSLSQITDLPLDVHLMMYNADRYIEEFSNAGANYITVHQEALPHLHSTIQDIKAHGVKAGISLNPATEVSLIKSVLPDIDMVLIMSVNPGFGGQKFLDLAINKITQLDAIRQKNNYDFLIEVDGGINMYTTPLVVEAGVDVLVAGNAVFGSDNIGKSCSNIKKLANEIRAKRG